MTLSDLNAKMIDEIFKQLEAILTPLVDRIKELETEVQDLKGKSNAG